MSRLYHGGVPGLTPGELLTPSAPHVVDGCPVCVARAAGRICTVGEYLAWAIEQPPSAAREKLVRQLLEAPLDAPIDPPSEVQAIYMTTDLRYATWYAARSRGDLYQVVPLGPVTRSLTDHFPTWHTPSARVLRVIRRAVRLDRRERRALDRAWRKADAAFDQRVAS